MLNQGSFVRHPALITRHNRNGGPTGGVLMAFRQFGAAAATAVTLAFAASPANAVTEIQWWHAMTGPNNDVVVKLANDFNASQSDYKIVPAFKGSYADVLNAGIAAFRAGNAPGIMQVFEVGTATMMAAKGAIKPVYELMKEQGEPFDPKSYLPATIRPPRATCSRSPSTRRAW
jgi:sn-glycerol 3-phosphate transport system substrate-binding protein